MAKGDDKKKSAAELEAEALELEHAHHMRHMCEEAGAGADSTASIFRLEAVAGRKGEPKFLESVATNQIWDRVYEYLAERWGGGEYRVRLKNADGTFVKGIPQLKYAIEGNPIPKDGPPPEEQRRLDELQAKIDKALEGKGGDGPVSSADLMRLMLEVTREQMREMRNPPTAAFQANPGTMAVEMMTALSTAQAPLLAALIERASSPAPDMMAQMKGMAEMIATLRDLTSGGDKGSSGWARIADRLADPLAGMFEQHVKNQAAGLAPPATYAGPRLVQEEGEPMRPNPPQQIPNGQRPRWLELVGSYLPQLVQFAQANRDPVITADFIAEGIPDTMLVTIYEQLSAPTFAQEWQRWAPPEAQPFGEWFNVFFGRIMEWVGPPDDGDQEEAPSSSAESSSSGDDASSSKPEVGTVAGGDTAP